MEQVQKVAVVMGGRVTLYLKAPQWQLPVYCLSEVEEEVLVSVVEDMVIVELKAVEVRSGVLKLLKLLK